MARGSELGARGCMGGRGWKGVDGCFTAIFTT